VSDVPPLSKPEWARHAQAALSNIALQRAVREVRDEATLIALQEPGPQATPAVVAAAERMRQHARLTIMTIAAVKERLEAIAKA
jgi:hypothetical protein